MARSQEQEDLNIQYKNLQHDWNSFKASNPHRSSLRHQAPPRPPDDVLQLMDSSPRSLITSLQEGPSASDGWKVRTNDLAIEEIVREREATIKSGKLKGRRLFDAPENADVLSLQGMGEICSASSSVLIQRSEVQSLCSSYDDEEQDHSDGANCSCSCSCSSFCAECVKNELMDASVEGDVDGCGRAERWADRMAWLVLVLVVFVLGLMSSWRSLDGEEGDQLVPT